MGLLGGSDDSELREYVAGAYPRLLRTAYLLTGDRHDAEDLTQATLARLVVAWRRVRRAESPDAYARRVMVNTHISRWRRRREAERPAGIDFDQPVRDRGHGRIEDQAVLKAALNGLSPRQRAAVVLRYYDDLSITETAEVLGCAEGTVKALTHRGLARLREILEVPECATTL